MLYKLYDFCTVIFRGNQYTKLLHMCVLTQIERYLLLVSIYNYTHRTGTIAN